MSSSHILLISGPSGSGKSVFIRQLQQGNLSPEILGKLPASATFWPIVEANDILKGDLPLEPLLKRLQQGDSMIVHYDIVFLHCRGLHDYRQDPAMALWEAASHITAVFVKPAPEIVLLQHKTRSLLHQEKKSPASRAWAKYVRLPLRRLFSPLTGKPTLRTMDLYQRAHWLNDCYHQWQEFLMAELKPKQTTSLLLVAPDTSSPSTEKFVLLDHKNLGTLTTQP